MNRRIISVLIVFLLASVTIPAAAAAEGTSENNVDDSPLSFVAEAIDEIKQVNRMAITSPDMHDIYIHGAVGAVAGSPGGIGGATVGGSCGIAEGIYEKLREADDDER